MADNGLTAAMSRQAGLMKDLAALANNIANADTTGYRAEGVIFSEYVSALESGESLSMTRANARLLDLTQGPMNATGAPLDLAIEGDGFFVVESSAGPRLTRAGAFSLNGIGALVDKEGRRVLDPGGAPIETPPNTAEIAVSADGFVSADGAPVGQIAVVTAAPTSLVREGDALFAAEDGYQPSERFAIVQGAIEESNVNAMGEFARLIEVQRAYETGKSFIDKENERLERMIRNLGQPPA